MSAVDGIATMVLSEAIVTQAGQCGLEGRVAVGRTMMADDTLQVGTYLLVITSRDHVVTLQLMMGDQPAPVTTARFVNAPGSTIIHAAVALLVEAFLTEN